MSIASASPNSARDIGTSAQKSPFRPKNFLSAAILVLASFLLMGCGPEPVVIANADGRLEVFVINSSDNSVWHAWQTQDHVWSQWQSLGGWADQLSVVRTFDNRLQLFVRGFDQALYTKSQESPGSFRWSDWENLGGGVLTTYTGQSAIAPAVNSNGRLEVFVIGTDNQLHHKWQDCRGCAWSGWDHQGGWADQIAVAQNYNGRLEVFVRGSDLALHHKFQTNVNGPGLSDWYHRGGALNGIGIAVQLNYDLELETFVVGTDNGIWHNAQTTPDRPEWSGWYSLSPWLDRIYASRHADGRLEIFGRGSDGAMYRKYELSPYARDWSDWIYEGTTPWGPISQPIVERNHYGLLEAFTRGMDGLIYHKSASCDGPRCGWSEWESIGAPEFCPIDSGSTPSVGGRMLTCGEVKAARQVFGDSIDYSKVRVHQNTYFWGQSEFGKGDTAVTPDGTIYWARDDGDLSVSTQFGYSCKNFATTAANETCVLIHEMTHVWQWQHGWSGSDLLFQELYLKQTLADPYAFGTLDPDPTKPPILDQGKPFVCYNFEQQGDIAIGIYYHVYQNFIPPNDDPNAAVPAPGQCP